MAGKIYVGNGSNKAKKPSKIYVGGSDNKAHLVKAIYVGDSSNKARKVWPTSILPNGYTQLEYLGIKTGGIRLDDLGSVIYPRIVMEFMAPYSVSSNWSENHILILWDIESFWYPGGSAIPDEQYLSSVRISGTGFNVYERICDNVNRVDTPFDWMTPVKENSVNSNTTEGLLLNTKYIVDYRNNNNVYLYSSDGYYSITSHNLLYSGLTDYAFKRINDTSGYVDVNYGYQLFHSDGLNTYGNSEVNIYSCLMYDGSTLIRNFIPSYRNSDNRLGYYDTVNRIFYTEGQNKTYAANDPDLCGPVM